MWPTHRSEAERRGAEWSGAERSEAERRGVKRSGAKRSGAKQSGAERSGAKQSGGEWSGAKRSGAEWSGAVIIKDIQHKNKIKNKNRHYEIPINKHNMINRDVWACMCLSTVISCQRAADVTVKKQLGPDWPVRARFFFTAIIAAFVGLICIAAMQHPTLDCSCSKVVRWSDFEFLLSYCYKIN